MLVIAILDTAHSLFLITYQDDAIIQRPLRYYRRRGREQDTLAHFSPLFLEHYNQAFHFPGGHTPTEQEVKTWYAPLAQKMLMEF